MNGNIELLSPVGDFERLNSALTYGADAVYLAGKQFGMRTSPNNFSFEDLEEAIKICHAKNVKVYVTCNTIPHNDEIEKLPEYLEHLNKIEVDGIIIADLGVMRLAKIYAPDVDIHISTQAGIANYHTAMQFYEMGAKRVVLARELSLDEIITIKKNIPEDLEIEAFIHGAMCVSFSGRCLLSSYMTGRDANRGDCAQPCRWEYELIEKKRPDQRFSIEEIHGENKIGSTYIMNSRDMCTIEQIPLLIKAGINSFKIEGRAKSAYYVASTTAAYRKAIDFAIKNPEKEIPTDIVCEVEKTSHRPYSTGFYMGTEPGQSTGDSGYVRGWDVVAVCTGRDGEFLKLGQRNKFLKGSIANVLSPDEESFDIMLDDIYDKYLNPIDSAPHATMEVLLKTDKNVAVGSFFRIERK